MVQPKSKAKKATIDPTSLLSYGVKPTTKSALARWNARDELRFVSEKDSQVTCGALAYKRMEWVTENGYTYLSGISKCKSPHTCPHCTPKKIAEQRQAINMKTAQTLDTGGMIAYGTFTFSPSNAADLRGTYLELMKIGEKFRRIMKKIESQFGITHSVRILEETYSELGHWHPHFNFIIQIPYAMRKPDQTEFMDLVLDAWVHATELTGLTKPLKALQTLQYETDLTNALERNGYQTKHGRFPLQPPKPDHTGHFSKLSPWDVLNLALQGDTRWIAVWNEFEAATYRIHRIHFYKPKTPK